METGEIGQPFPPLRILVVAKQCERVKERCHNSPAMSSARSILTLVKTGFPQSSATFSAPAAMKVD